MTELDDRLEEGRAAVARMDPPADLWAQAIERAHADVPADLVSQVNAVQDDIAAGTITDIPETVG